MLRLEQVERLRDRHGERGQDGAVVGYSEPVARVAHFGRARLRRASGEVLATRGKRRVHVFVRHDGGNVGLEVTRAAAESLGASHRVRRRARHVVFGGGISGVVWVG